MDKAEILLSELPPMVHIGKNRTRQRCAGIHCFGCEYDQAAFADPHLLAYFFLGHCDLQHSVAHAAAAAELSENSYRAALPALKITGAKALSRGELVCCTQDRLRRVTAFIPD